MGDNAGRSAKTSSATSLAMENPVMEATSPATESLVMEVTSPATESPATEATSPIMEATSLVMVMNTAARHRGIETLPQQYLNRFPDSYLLERKALFPGCDPGCLSRCHSRLQDRAVAVSRLYFVSFRSSEMVILIL